MKISYVRIQQIITVCVQQNIRPADIAETKGLSTSTVYRIINRSTQNPSIKILLQIEDYLRENCPDAFDEKGNIKTDDPLEFNEDYKKAILLIDSIGSETDVTAELKELIKKMALDMHQLDSELGAVSRKNHSLLQAYDHIKDTIANV